MSLFQTIHLMSWWLASVCVLVWRSQVQKLTAKRIVQTKRHVSPLQDVDLCSSSHLEISGADQPHHQCAHCVWPQTSINIHFLEVLINQSADFGLYIRPCFLVTFVVFLIITAFCKLSKRKTTNLFVDIILWTVGSWWI